MRGVGTQEGRRPGQVGQEGYLGMVASGQERGRAGGCLGSEHLREGRRQGSE